jgi:hypothetical protein
MWRNEMTTLLAKSIYRSAIAKAVLLGLMAVCGWGRNFYRQEATGFR